MRFLLQVSTLSPLHIGSGETLLREYDFVTVGDRTWRLNAEAIWAEEFDRAAGDEAQLNERLAVPPGQLVRASELREGSKFVRYALAGITSVDQVREQIKTVMDECYLPGSTLKGALRTALVVRAIESKAVHLIVGDLGDRRERAGEKWERQTFGGDPTHDLMRAITIADSHLLSPAQKPLMLLNAQVFTGGNDQPGSPIAVEAIRADMTFELSLKVDDYIFSPAAERLDLHDRRLWLDAQTLTKTVNDYTVARMRREAAFAAEHDLKRPGQFYTQLLKRKPGAGQMLIQIGWGVGWGGKTVVPWLDKPMQDQIRTRFKLGKPPKAGRDWEPDLAKPFPKSRRLRARQQDAKIVADVPLGWVLVEMKESR